MAATKYGHLVKTLKYEATDGDGGSPEYMTMPTGADLEGINLSFAWGYRHKVGTWGSDGGLAHTHPYGEILVFTGLDYDHPASLGAAMELALGDKGEKHTFDSPHVVILPPNVTHCPLTSTRVDRPFGFLAISLSGEHDLKPASRGGGAATMDYGQLVKPLELHDTKRTSGGNADFIHWWNGKDLEGFNLNFTWAFHTGTGIWHERDPHVHPNDEVLLFVGLDPENPDYLGAELSIAMGKEQEVHVFDKPTVVVAPRGLVHCPLITRRVDKPYSFSAISLNTEHKTTWLGKKKG